MSPTSHQDHNAETYVNIGDAVCSKLAGLVDPALAGFGLAGLGLARRLRFPGLDRSRKFGWCDSAEKVWQLHADL